MKFECESKSAKMLMKQRLIQIKNIYAESEVIEPGMHVHNFYSLKGMIKRWLRYYKNKRRSSKIYKN